MATPENALAPPFDEVRDVPTDQASAEGATWGSVPFWLPISFFTVEVRLVVSAVAIIFVGAYASLRRPPSAAPAPKKKKKHGGKSKDKKEDEEEPFIQGLLASDAILFPFMAGFLLVGLYYLIQWLKDPAILNKVFRWYTSIMSVASLTTFISQSLQLMTSFVFPKHFRCRGMACEVDGVEERVRPVRNRQGSKDSDSDSDDAPPVWADAPASLTTCPIPVRPSWVTPNVNNMLWELRHFLTEEWTVEFRVHGLVQEKFKMQFSHIVGFVSAIGVVFFYFVTGSQGLSNLMGYGFCYASFLLVSPTSFPIGNLVLSGLFVYDIVMVFFTPYMVTVATKIDAPIKLTFESAQRSSMLGLGDIVIPGIVMCLALRFDHWRYYQRQIRYEETRLETEVADPDGDGDGDGDGVRKVTETRHVAKKAPYVDITGTWADWFWLTSWSGLLLGSKPRLGDPESVRAAAFPKTYFYASVAGYLLGMCATMAMLLVFKHGQPALLYLVPGVLGSLWTTGFARGELREMWEYTEDGSLDKQDVIVELDGKGNVLKEMTKDGQKEDEEQQQQQKEKKKGEEKKAVAKRKRAKEKQAKNGYHVFLVSIRAPPRRKGGGDIDGVEEKKDDDGLQSEASG